VSGAGAAARDVLLVARFELAEAVRSRLLIVMVLLFVGAGALGAWGYTSALERIESGAAKITGAPTAGSGTQRPGGVMRRLRTSGSYRGMLRAFLKDDRKADYFAELPPIVVFFGWASFAFTPWLLLFTSSETIAGDVATRAIRFSALRTGRLSFALGKALGQAAIIAGVTALQAATFFVVASVSLTGFEPGATAVGLLSFWPRVFVYVLPFLAWAMFASMATASTNLARTLALGGAVLLAILSGLASPTAPPAQHWHLRGGPVRDTFWDLVSYLTPFGHSEGLSYPPGGRLGSDLAICLALTVLYFALGFTVLRRRDL
jgi:ABC-type transport system involved in multi-copper enzyme maturation permease subunit